MSNMPTLIEPRERVLSTLNKDGSRRWLKPRVSRGSLWRSRRALAWILIAIFVALPLLRINSRPAILLDVVKREFTFFGKVFLPTDTLLMALLMLSLFLTVFLVTALFGRVWCGWACPQTVYMEFVFRPLERWAEGEPGRTKKHDAYLGLRQGIKYALYALISVALAHVFLSYFVGWERLIHWMIGSPFNHVAGFITVLLVSALMMFDFAYFREQTCIVACPYGRFQSVLLDRKSTIVAYDLTRGEPRGKLSKSHPDVPLPVMGQPEPHAASHTGDCVDCGLCVQTCPTGIDIREGLQMECINCTQCIDACDAVMTRVKRPTGLIRLASLDEIEGKKQSAFRPRLFIYPLALVISLGSFITLLAMSKPADVTFLRARGLPYNLLLSGEIANTLRVKITNRTDEPRDYSISIAGADDLRLEIAENPMHVAAGQMREEPMLVVGPASMFTKGRATINVTISDGGQFTQQLTYGLLGPSIAPAPGAPR